MMSNTINWTKDTQTYVVDDEQLDFPMEWFSRDQLIELREDPKCDYDTARFLDSAIEQYDSSYNPSPHYLSN